MILQAKNPVVFDKLPIIVYDGHCIFCSKLVKISLLLGVHKKFYFTTIDSKLTKELTANFDISKINLGDSALVITKNKLYSSADAVLYIMKNSNLLLKFLYFIFSLFPSSVLNGFYYFLARRRYKILGRSSSCIVPTKELRSKFIGIED